jgi:mannose-6-phosphate isomerase-like protein (cupin superfamily)
LEVVEITCPALHETFSDADMTLPTETVAAERDFGGQRFVFHRAEDADWKHSADGFERRAFGFSGATDGLVEASVLRPVVPSTETSDQRPHTGELLFWFVLEGSTTLRRAGGPDQPLRAGDSVAMPADESFALVDRSTDLEVLEVSVPPGA